MMKRKKRFWAIAMTLIMCFGVTGVLSTDVKAAKTSEVQAQEEYPGDVIGTATINLVQSCAIGENGNVKGDGARLRKQPKKSATVLELMYNGEHFLYVPHRKFELTLITLCHYALLCQRRESEKGLQSLKSVKQIMTTGHR